MKKILIIPFHGLGDIVTSTSFPENFYKQTGEKIYLFDNIAEWAFRDNPYIISLKSIEETYKNVSILLDSRDVNYVNAYVNFKRTYNCASQAEWIAFTGGLDINNLSLRHPKFYFKELDNVFTENKKLVIHTSGSDRSKIGEENIRYSLGEDSERIISDEIINVILEKYKDWNIVQLGGLENKKINSKRVKDLRGKLSLNELVKEISTANRFIGVNSGLMHIANAFPNVEKRIILMEFPKSTLINFRPCDLKNFLFCYLDTSNLFFNKFKDDIGLTYSYEKF